MKKALIFFFLFFISLLIFSFFTQDSKKNHQAEQEKKVAENKLPEAEKKPNQATSRQEDNNKEKDKINETKEEGLKKDFLKMPAQHLNKTPFVVQAPFGNWDELHKEACEEAALVMANAYLENRKSPSPEKADKELISLVKFAEEKLQHKPDINTWQMKDLFSKYYNQKVSIVEKPTAEEIKKHLLKKGIVIAPAAGRVLDNPYFQNPGPLYHALVVIGYDESKKQFITNDPGTRKGEGFRYNYQNLMKSIHDLPESNKKEDILEGEKRVLFIHKKMGVK